MISKITEKQATLLLLLLFVILGFLTVKSAFVATLLGILFFLVSMLLIVLTQNSTGVAHYAAGFIMAAEVYFRMSGSGLPWEFGKYAIIFLLSAGMLFDKVKRPLPLGFLLYIFLLLPAILLSFAYYDDTTLLKKRVIFNMIGPLVLFVSAVYFYKYKMTLEEFTRLSRWILYGIVVMGVYILFKVGDYSAIQYTYSSNADSSGGFSGNQVSIAFGIGIMVLIINMVLNNRVFYWIWIELLLLFMFIFQGLMTFSRGGISSALIAAILGVFVYYFSNVSRVINFFRKNFLKIILGFAFASGTFYYVNEVTNGFLYARYFNTDSKGYKIKADVTTGRGDIVHGDIALLTGSGYVGVGAGVAVLERPTHKGYAAHVEYTRMLAEHGILGVIALLIMFLIPAKQFIMIWGHPTTQILFVSFMTLSLLTMTHAAMRLGMIGFFYGLAFILIVNRGQNE